MEYTTSDRDLLAHQSGQQQVAGAAEFGGQYLAPSTRVDSNLAGRRPSLTRISPYSLALFQEGPEHPAFGIPGPRQTPERPGQPSWPDP